MFAIHLGITPSGIIPHWEIVLHYEGPDDSMENLDLDEIDSDLFRNLESGRPDSLHEFILIGAEDENGFEQWELKIDMANSCSDSIERSESLGTFPDSKLSEIIAACRELPLPGLGENCQNFAWSVLENVLAGKANMEQDWYLRMAAAEESKQKVGPIS
jgi:hypothetical protein